MTFNVKDITYLTDPTSLDLFCGCGGFTIGLHQAGFNCLAAIDFNKEAIETLKKNIPSIKHVLQKDLTTYHPEELAKLIGVDTVDVIVGGPPCQGFSIIRQGKTSNHGISFVEDARRYLYQDFLRFVDFFKPKVFVIENVTGIRSVDGGKYFTDIQHAARQLGYRVYSEQIHAANYGAPQKRIRQFIIGTKINLSIFYTEKYFKPTHYLPKNRGNQNLSKYVTLGEAIGDLPPLAAGSGSYIAQYDIALRDKHFMKYTDRFAQEVTEMHEARYLTSHVARFHSDRDLRDFARIREGETSLHAIARGEDMEFPYDRNSFKDRFTRQNSEDLCSTIVAHLSKDGLMFIHPDQNRSLTVREAARVQTFPDWYEFPESRTHAYRMIGNAVPSIVARRLGEGIKEYLQSQADNIIKFDTTNSKFDFSTDLSSDTMLREVNSITFARIWREVLLQEINLHPLGIFDLGDDTIHIPHGNSRAQFKTIYKRSGWPVSLNTFVREAARRLKSGELSQHDFYLNAS